MKKINLILSIIAWSILAISCQQKSKEKSNTSSSSESTSLLDSSIFDAKIDGKLAKLYTLKNKNGMQIQLTNFGARIVSLQVPDKNNKLIDVVLGFSKALDYKNPEEPYFGTTVGPFANRIAKGTFSIDGEIYKTPTNNGPNTLHGGYDGIHFAVWNAQPMGNAIQFSYTLPDKKEGFPGNIAITVTYSILDDNSINIAYEAKTDKKTVINLSNHSYFNLNGEGSGTILNHNLQLFADNYTPVDSTLIPTGEIKAVKNTAFDFTVSKTIGKDIEAKDQQLTFGKGYDHNFVLNKTKVNGLNHAASIVGDISGIRMDIYTSEPGIQFYSGNFMADKVKLKGGKTDSFRTGFCLEPQNFPDAPNQPNFPSSILDKNQIYKSQSTYTFTNN